MSQRHPATLGALCLAVTLGPAACSKRPEHGIRPAESTPATLASTTLSGLRDAGAPLDAGRAAPDSDTADHAAAAALDASATDAASADGAVGGRLAGKVVLHAGDSMVGGEGGLTRALGVKFRAEGAKFVKDYEVSVSIGTFARASRFPKLLARHKPDLVILTLGANDVFIPFPQNFAPHVEAIVKKIGDRECYWIGPPTWKPDSGIVAVIREHAAPCKFFDSSNLPLKRGGDRIHPTEKGGAEWADLFWAHFQGTGPSAPGLVGLLDAGPP